MLRAAHFTSLAFVVPILLVYECGHPAAGARSDAEWRGRVAPTILGLGWLWPIPSAANFDLCDSCGMAPSYAMPLVSVGRSAGGYAAGISTVGHPAPDESRSCKVGCSWRPAHCLGPPAVVSTNVGEVGTRVIGFFGAGIYEELLFRLMLLPSTVRPVAVVGRVAASKLDRRGSGKQPRVFGRAFPDGHAWWRAFHVVQLSLPSHCRCLLLSAVPLSGIRHHGRAHTLYDVFVGMLVV